MLTYKPFADEDFSYIQDKLNLTDFKVQNLTSPDEFKVNHVEIGSLGLEATWTPGLPSKTIWKQSLPFVAVLLFMISGSLLLVSIRYSRMLDALQNSEAQNKFLAMHDALTGLPNRLQFDHALEDTISEGHQDRCAILCLDLDRFKVVNDVWGHQAGDVVIQTVADRIANTVGDDGMTARIGGDEFIVLLKNQLDQQSVLNLCTSIINAVRKEVSFESGSAQVGASIGVAWWPDDAQTTKNIIRSADEALYRAKENGRGCTYMASNDNAGDVGKFRESLRA
jgi:diguanylate cyclase (GGDEF)-like protein